MVWKPDSKARDTHPYQLNQRSLGILQEAPGGLDFETGERNNLRGHGTSEKDALLQDAVPIFIEGMKHLPHK